MLNVPLQQVAKRFQTTDTNNCVVSTGDTPTINLICLSIIVFPSSVAEYEQSVDSLVTPDQ
jgi:hypothetical protein